MKKSKKMSHRQIKYERTGISQVKNILKTRATQSVAYPLA